MLLSHGPSPLSWAPACVASWARVSGRRLPPAQLRPWLISFIAPSLTPFSPLCSQPTVAAAALQGRAGAVGCRRHREPSPQIIPDRRVHPPLSRPPGLISFGLARCRLHLPLRLCHASWKMGLREPPRISRGAGGRCGDHTYDGERCTHLADLRTSEVVLPSKYQAGDGVKRLVCPMACRLIQSEWHYVTKVMQVSSLISWFGLFYLVLLNIGACFQSPVATQ